MCSNDTSPRWEKGELILSSLTKSGTGCVLYFEKPSSKKTLAKLGSFTIVKAPTSYSTTDTDDHENTIYSTEDNDGTSYFYRGAAKNNWVKFGTNDDNTKDVWWRIIRINGDGTIRLIYTGMYNKDTNPDPGSNAYVTGEETLVITKQPFADPDFPSDNTYIGFYYGTEGGIYPQNHSNTTPNNAATQLINWYNGENWNAEKYRQYIDEDAGFCNDRTIHPTPKTWFTYEGDSGRGAGNVVTAYGAYSRLFTQTNSIKDYQTPTLLCGKNPEGDEVDQISYKRDLFTLVNAKKGNGVLEVPVGLITIDEVIFAGGFGGKNNTDYYLYNNQYFWTMSPRVKEVGGRPAEYIVNVNAQPSSASVNTTNPAIGVRPVINLRADTKLSGKGTSDDPYTVVMD